MLINRRDPTGSSRKVREALVEESIQRVVQLLPVVVGLDQHWQDGVGEVSGEEVEPRHCPSLQVRSDLRPGSDTGGMGPARPVAVKVADQELVIVDELKKLMSVVTNPYNTKLMHCLVLLSG